MKHKPDYNDPKIFEPMDAEEAEIMAERDQYIPLASAEEAELRQQLKAAASNSLKKTERTNVRLTRSDLDSLKRLAAKEGVGYQTLITSVLHKVASGQIEL